MSDGSSGPLVMTKKVAVHDAAIFFFGSRMVTPAEWISEKTKEAKSVVAANPDDERLKGEMKTAEQERNFRERNYFGNPQSKFQTKKPVPIRLKSSKIVSGRIDLGRGRD